jgi:hypothetical protein
MSNPKSPYSFGGNGAGSLAQSISKIGEAFGGLSKAKQRLNDKMLDSEIRIRERAINDVFKSSLKKKEMKTAGKVERKIYKGQVKTNVKAAERLTGTEKGKGVVKPGSNVSFSRENMSFTAKDAPKPKTSSRKPAAKSSNKAMVSGANIPKAPVTGTKPSSKPATSTPKAAAPKASSRKAV